MQTKNKQSKQSKSKEIVAPVNHKLSKRTQRSMKRSNKSMKVVQPEEIKTVNEDKSKSADLLTVSFADLVLEQPSKTFVEQTVQTS